MGQRKNSMQLTQDLRPDSTWSLKEVDLPSIPKFFVSSVHYNWVLRREMNIVDLAVSATEKCDLALDVGMNDGFYSQLLAARGCEVHSFEIQPRCIEVSCMVTAANNFRNKINIYESPVTAKHGDVVVIPVGNTTTGSCDGGFSFHTLASETRGHLPFKRIGERRLFGVKLDELFALETRDISFMKIDTEGHEFQVLKGAMGLFERRQITSAVFEANPSFWREEDTASANVLDAIINFGYHLKCSKTDFKLKEASDIFSRPGDCGIDIFIVRDANFPVETSTHRHKTPLLSGQNHLLLALLAAFLLIVALRRRTPRPWLQIPPTNVRNIFHYKETTK